MGLIGLVAGLGMFCVLLWYCAIYALPVYVAFSAGWWALNHGAGIGCVAVGAIAGASLFWFGQTAASKGNKFVRRIALAAFVIPAAYMGFEIVEQLALQMAPTWRYIFAALGAVAAGGTALARLSPANRMHQPG